MPEKASRRRTRRSGDRDTGSLPDITLNALLLCQNVLEEKDGSLTAVRIIDRVGLEIEAQPAIAPDAPLPPLPIGAVLLVVLRKQVPEELKRTANVTVTGPSGKITAITALPVTIGPGIGKGQNLILRLAFSVEAAGVYWFNLSLDDKLVGRVPLEVVISRIQGPTPAAS